MNIYLSGLVGSGIEGEHKLMEAIPADKRYRCFTFYYLYPALLAGKENRYLKTFEWALKNKIKIMMDSGAHTLQKFYEKGKKANFGKRTLEETLEDMFQSYCQFCKKFEKKVDFYVTFDYQSNVDVTWKMTRRMKKLGLKPVPVFHGDQSVEWLGKYADEGYDYLGISGLNTTEKARFNKKAQMEYLDSCFRYIDHYKGKEYRTHGFATTKLELMFGYPWTSVDSSTWLQCAAYGKVICLNTKTRRLELIHTSRRKSGAGSYWRLEKNQRRLYDQVFEQYGTNIEKLAGEATPGLEARMIFNAKLFATCNITCEKYKPRFERLF